MMSRYAIERKRRVLVVDDVPNNLKVLQNFLIKNDYEVFTASDGAEGVEVAIREKPDLILLDIMMPVMDGYDACKAIRNNPEISDVPIIFITAKNQQEDILMAFEAGGNDYVVKPFFFQEVLLRIKVHVENKLLREKLFNLSMTDSLTGLWNRRYFLEQLDNELRRSVRYEHDLTFVIMDIDNFKQLNDKFGHCAGDAVLRKLGSKLLHTVRDLDYICRWGGEEFVLLLPETTKRMAAALVQRIRDEINLVKTDVDGNEISITMSYGIAGLEDLQYSIKDFDLLYNIADERLYQAKKAGKDRIVFE